MRRMLLVALGAAAIAGCGMSEADAGMGGSPHWSGEPGGAPWHGGEQYQQVGENPFVETAQDARATFGVDVDTASYALMRRDLHGGYLPHVDGVRVEEYLNYFSYGYEPPVDEAFAAHLEAAPSPFGEGLHLLRVGLQARSVAERGRANLVFLVDVSGSMDEPDKLPLVKRTLSILLDELRPDDTVALVVYSGAVGTVLEPTPASMRSVIQQAIDRLGASGSTNGEGGIRAAYELAQRHFEDQGINRVILATDGDFNVGLYGDPLIDLIQEKRASGVYLTTLGFGSGNYNGAQMERLAAHGNGNYAYVDGIGEAERVVRRDLLSTMVVVAEDTKVQLTFDPQVVKRHRLLGYENRAIDDDDFVKDDVDTGDVGAGHDVTALLEIELQPGALESDAALATLAIRYQPPGAATDTEMTAELHTGDVLASFDEASASTRFAAAVAEYAEILRRSSHSIGADFAQVRAIAAPLVGGDADRAEFVELVDTAAGIWR